MESLPREQDLVKLFEIAKEMAFEEGAGWTVYSDDGVVKQEHKTYDFCPINAHRVEACEAFYSNMGYEQYHSVDATVTSHKLVEQVNEDERVKIQDNALGWPIWPRQSLFRERRFKVDNGVWFVSVSTEHDSQPYDKSQVVRTTFHTGVFAFLREGDKTKIIRLLHIDANGSIPAIVINNAASIVTKVIHYFLSNVK